MHFHLPKPLHGWREFAGEVGIIVLGILIALSLEQLVERWHWGEQLKTTHDSLAEEIATSARSAVERIATEDCMRARIADLTAKLNASNSHWAADPMKLGPVRERARFNSSMPVAYRAPIRDWGTDAWDAAKATGTINRMPADEVADYERIYGSIAGIRMLQQHETELAPRLSVLSFDQQMDNASRLQALTTLAELDTINARMSRWSWQLLQAVKPLHLHVDRAAHAQWLQATFVAQQRLRGNCVKPMRVDF